MKSNVILQLENSGVSLELTLRVPDEEIKALTGNLILPKPIVKRLINGVFSDLMPSEEYMLEVGDFVKYRLRSLCRTIEKLKDLEAQAPEEPSVKKTQEVHKNKEVEPQ